jgi:thioredoxin 1
MLGELIKKHPVVLVDFYADWCEPCKWLNPILDDLPSKLGETLFIQKINIDEHAPLSASYEIKSVPVLMLFVNGENVWRMNGFLYAKELAEIIRKHL